MMDWGRRLACRLFDAATVERLINPTMADAEWERQQFLRTGRPWRARWSVAVSVVALARVIAVCILESLARILGAVLKQDAAALGRLISFTVISVGLLTLVLIMPPYESAPARLRPNALLWLVPQALGLALPAGFLIGALLALRGRASTLRVFRTTIATAVALSVMTFIVLEVLVPRANQAFRVMVSRIVTGRGNPEKGPNEMTMTELSGRIRILENRPGQERSVRRLRYAYEVRWSVALMPIAFALYAFGASAIGRGRWSVAIAGIVVAACLIGMLGVDPRIPWMVWSPLIVFGLIGSALSLRAFLRPQSV